MPNQELRAVDVTAPSSAASVWLLSKAPCGTFEQLAQALTLPIIEDVSEHVANIAPNDLLVERINGAMSLRAVSKRYGGPVAVSFPARGLHNKQNVQQLLPKAVGLAKCPGFYPSVLDATAGLGQDAYQLALLGCRVSLIEQHPVIHALLADGIDRDAPENLTLLPCQNACDYLEEARQSKSRYDVVYLDPMFPDISKQAKTKKHMAYLQVLLANTDDQGEQLLSCALHVAKQRVVVKRKRHAPLLSPSYKPHTQYTGKLIRYDVYLPR